MKKAIILLAILLSYGFSISQYVIINNTNMGGINLPFAKKYISPFSDDGQCNSIYNYYIDLDLDNINDLRITAKCAVGGPYNSGSLSIETFNNFQVHVDTNYQTTIATTTDTGLYYLLTKIPVPKKYLLNDTIYQNAYSWHSIETIIGAHSYTNYGDPITWIDLDYFENDTTYIALTKNDGNSKVIYYLQLYVLSSRTMNILAINTNDSTVLSNYIQNCFPYGITFNKQSQIDNFQDIALNCSLIEGGVVITGEEINNLNGLSNITSIKGDLRITNTNSLNDLSGLENLNIIDGNIYITNNDSLQTLSGLDNIEPTSIKRLIIDGNHSLSTCNIKSICGFLSQYPSYPWDIVIIDNNTNGCNYPKEVELGCDTTGISDYTYLNGITLSPNPASNELHIDNSIEGEKIYEINIYNLNGQRLLLENKNCKLLNVSFLNSGMYIIELKMMNLILRRKLIIN